ncbi:MAG: SDR family NAD(P)-dependent oxidoreductase [Actinomycetota bacterium]
MSVAIITGASRGLGLALARALAERRWELIIDARGADALASVAGELDSRTRTLPIPGDVADEEHRRALISAARSLGRLDLLANNAAVLGPSPPPRLSGCSLDALRHVFEINALAPLRLLQMALPLLESSQGRVVNVTSDAAVTPYLGWGLYGSSKAALEALSAVAETEHPGLRIYRVDPGDMNTLMEQEGFPDEDVSDRPSPDAAVPGLLALVEGDLPSGRYRAQAMDDL